MPRTHDWISEEQRKERRKRFLRIALHIVMMFIFAIPAFLCMLRGDTNFYHDLLACVMLILSVASFLEALDEKNGL